MSSKIPVSSDLSPRNGRPHPARRKEALYAEVYVANGFVAARASKILGIKRQALDFHLEKPQVQHLVDHIWEEQQQAIRAASALNQQWVIDRLQAEAERFDEGSTHTARVRALELIGKHLGMFQDRLRVESESAVEITFTRALVDADTKDLTVLELADDGESSENGEGR